MSLNVKFNVNSITLFEFLEEFYLALSGKSENFLFIRQCVIQLSYFYMFTYDKIFEQNVYCCNLIHFFYTGI